MNIYDLEGTEDDPVYQELAATNLARHYDFLESMIEAAIASGRPWLSQSLIKALNFHAIVGLHHEAGRYRSHEVTVGGFEPHPHYRVEPLMDDFVNEVNWKWAETEAMQLAAYALWKITNIHPFVNGNGRTARAVCYFILCVKTGGLLPGDDILPERLSQDHVRPSYIDCLQAVDNEANLDPLTDLILGMVARQVQGTPP